MTQKEICVKYGFRRDFVSTFIKQKGIKPIGAVIGRIHKQYDEKQFVSALLADYKGMYQKSMKRAEEYKGKYIRIKEIYKRSEGKKNESAKMETRNREEPDALHGHREGE